VSLADLIVLGGSAAIEKAAKDAGLTVTVPFMPAAWTRRRSRRHLVLSAHQMRPTTKASVKLLRRYSCGSRQRGSSGN